MALMDMIRRFFGIEKVTPFDEAEHQRRLKQIDEELYRFEDQVRREMRQRREQS